MVPQLNFLNQPEKSDNCMSLTRIGHFTEAAGNSESRQATLTNKRTERVNFTGGGRFPSVGFPTLTSLATATRLARRAP